MVSQAQVSHIHISFMLAGHTKFALDRLFAKTGSAYKTADVFTIHELQTLCTPSASTVVEDGDNVLTWRDSLGGKYSDLPGVRKLHDFLIVKGYDRQVVMKVREKCFTGEWRQSPLRLLDATAPGIPTTTYNNAHTHNIKDDKLANMVTMYNRFIAPDRRPEYLPPLQPALTLQRQPISTSTTQHQPTSTSGRREPPRRRKQSKCTVEGCDGRGHRNKARWSEGHSTRDNLLYSHNTYGYYFVYHSYLHHVGRDYSN